jgi:spore germination cell wall hydrolase CwlJ-like protein
MNSKDNPIIRGCVLTGIIRVCVFFLFILIINAIVTERLTKTDKLDTQVVSLKERERQLECLSKNIYYEAASEPFEGKVGVAQVTLNRANSGKFPADICQVVYQKNIVYDKIICQFSWFCETASKTKPINETHFNESKAVAQKVLLEGFRLESLHEAIFYHADYVNPKWNKEKIIKIGRHIFYKG